MVAMVARTQDGGEGRWDDVRVFLATFRLRSLGAAAVRLGVDTSTVSRRLTALETALGAQLFDRSREGLVPRRAAELLLPSAEAMEAAHARLGRDASGKETTAEGVVRVSAAPGIMETFVAPAVARLRARHPGLTLELDGSARVVDLTRHEADLALRSTKPQGAELVMTKLASATWVPVASPALVKELGIVQSWADPTWIVWDRELSSFAPSRWQAQHAGKAPIALRTSHAGSQMAALRAGAGVALVPDLYAAAYGLEKVRYAKRLKESAAQLPVDDLWLVAHRTMRGVARVDAVWDFIVAEVRGAVGKRS